MQFTSNIWSKLCEMLHISHRQTTAYHPELNGAVERLHRRLRDALRARTAAASWYEELPFVLLGLHAQLRETLVFPRLRQFLALQLSCPTNFCKEMNFLLMKLSKKFKTTLDAPAFSLPRHNSTTQVAPRRHRPASPPPLRRPYAVLQHGPPSFTIRVGSRDEIVSVSCLKACTEADATPGSPRSRVRLPGKRPGGLAATKWVSFSDPLVSSPSAPQALPSNSPGTVFPLRTGFLHALDQRRHPSLHSSSTHIVSGHCLRDRTSDLSSCRPTPELRGSPVEIWLHPWLTVKPLVYCMTLVQSLYISCYVSSNKLVLSYLLLCLLPQYS
jgi:hypothetical protein